MHRASSHRDRTAPRATAARRRREGRAVLIKALAPGYAALRPPCPRPLASCPVGRERQRGWWRSAERACQHGDLPPPAQLTPKVTSRGLAILASNTRAATSHTLPHGLATCCWLTRASGTATLRASGARGRPTAPR